MTPAQQIVSTRQGKWYGNDQGYGYIKCPVHDDRGPSCSVRDGERGVPLVNCKVGCSRPDIIAALRRDGAWPESKEFASRRDNPKRVRDGRRRYVTVPRDAPGPRFLNENEQERIAFARSIWDATQPARGSLVEPYWAEARGLSLDIPKVIRFGQSVPYGSPKPGRPPPQRYPAMIAGIQAPDGSFAGVHCTFLKPDGSDKESLPVDRLIFGVVGGCAVRLSDAAEEICIGEGLETTASYMQDVGIAGWAGMNTSGLQNIILPPLPLAFLISILVDNDVAGERASTNAAGRLRLEGRTPTLIRPCEGLKDFNDAHRRAA